MVDNTPPCPNYSWVDRLIQRSIDADNRPYYLFLKILCFLALFFFWGGGVVRRVKHHQLLRAPHAEDFQLSVVKCEWDKERKNRTEEKSLRWHDFGHISNSPGKMNQDQMSVAIPFRSCKEERINFPSNCNAFCQTNLSCVKTHLRSDSRISTSMFSSVLCASQLLGYHTPSSFFFLQLWNKILRICKSSKISFILCISAEIIGAYTETCRIFFPHFRTSPGGDQRIRATCRQMSPQQIYSRWGTAWTRTKETNWHFLWFWPNSTREFFARIEQWNEWTLLKHKISENYGSKPFIWRLDENT